MRPLRCLLAFSLAAALLAPAARATWSILIVDTHTGEVAIGSATCLANFNLERFLPVVMPGVGVAAAQSAIDSTGQNRMRIWELMHEGADPVQILQRLQLHDPSHQSRQYGMVDFTHAPLTFTGTGCAAYASGRTGQVGTLRYAIQGNILTGSPVLNDAEAALLATPGDVSQKLVAAMEAARGDGGDGRCSCSPSAPTSCGSPPPQFTYSAYTGFLIVARMGDYESLCNQAGGCASGEYWLNLAVISNSSGPEPVLQLEALYAQWRHQMHGVADAIQSRVVPQAPSLPADGATRVFVDVELRDVEGGPVTFPATLSLAVQPGSPDVHLSPAQDLGNGRFRFAVGAGMQPGTARVRVTALHQTRHYLLWPELVLEVEPLAPFACGFQEVSAAQGAQVPLVVNLGVGQALAPYIILASASGTQPGTIFGGTPVPLNEDGLFWASVAGANGPRFVHTAGELSALGRAQGTYVASPLVLPGLIGQRFDFAAVRFASASGPALATNADGFWIVP